MYLVFGLELWTTAWGWGWVGDMGVTVSLSKKAAALTNFFLFYICLILYVCVWSMNYYIKLKNK